MYAEEGVLADGRVQRGIVCDYVRKYDTVEYRVIRLNETISFLPKQVASITHTLIIACSTTRTPYISSLRTMILKVK